MKFSPLVAYIIAIGTASPFLWKPALAVRVKGRERFRDSASKRSEGGHQARRKLGGKGKGKGSPDDDFYRYPCEFCGEGNDSALGGELCFSKDMTVQVLGRGLVTMENLHVGDRVLTQNGVFQPVYAFGHREPNQEAPFLQIFTDNSDPLELTQDHLVYLANKENPVRAKSVKVGDILRSPNRDTTIHKIEVVTKKGIYAPLTLGGTIVVNDVLASSYISLQEVTTAEEQSQSTHSNEYMVIQGSKFQIRIMSHHQYVDMAIAPYRLMCRVMGNSYCETKGMPLYVELGIAFNRLSSPHWNAHAMVILTTIALSSPFWFFERALFSSYGSSSLLFLAAGCLVVAGWIALKPYRVRFVARKVKTE